MPSAGSSIRPLAGLKRRNQKGSNAILNGTRVGSPRRQGGLSEEERRRNVVGTFRCVRGFQSAAEGGETVLVVDDIMTTGSTLSECARELKRAGAARVWCVTLARSLRS